MENKIKKKSINTIIYLLLAAMFVCVVLISVYTVASKTSKPTPDAVDTTLSAILTEPVVEQTSAEPVNATPETSEAISASADTEEEPAPLPVAVTDGEDIPTSIDVRYFVLPVSGVPAKGFEIDIPVYSITMNDYRAHTGVDITAPIGSKVLAASTGVISRVWNDPMMGRCVTIDHGDNIFTTYMNLADELDKIVEVGAKVSMGQVIGAIGETSLVEIAEEPHLHLEMKINGNYVNPLDYISVGNYDDSVYE
jgi:murein DD-endopeptidase MepM/ murein hydrolase activator NlpD